MKQPIKIFGDSNFKTNRALHLVLFLSCMYILFQMVVILFIILSDAQKNAFEVYILPNTGLAIFDVWKTKVWTTISYALAHRSFIELAGNMFWLYCFATIISRKTSHQEVFWGFFVQYILIGLLYPIVSQWAHMAKPTTFLTALPAVVSMAFSALVLAWNSKLQSGVSVPFWLVLVVFLGLIALTSNYANPSGMLMFLIAAIVGVGFGIIWLLGWRPGVWVESRLEAWNEKMGGKDAKIDGWDLQKLEQQIRRAHPDWPEEFIQDLLNKVRQGGIGALSIRERGMLFNK